MAFRPVWVSKSGWHISTTRSKQTVTESGDLGMIELSALLTGSL